MKLISASRVRQRFRAVIAELKDEPLAVERHGKTIAYLVPPHHSLSSGQAARQDARLRQAALEQERLNRHLRIAVELLSGPRRQARLRIRRAQAEVRRWQQNNLCSQDYIRRWERMLSLPIADLAREMGSDQGEWGPALRQNSPWF